MRRYLRSVHWNCPYHLAASSVYLLLFFPRLADSLDCISSRKHLLNIFWKISKRRFYRQKRRKLSRPICTEWGAWSKILCRYQLEQRLLCMLSKEKFNKKYFNNNYLKFLDSFDNRVQFCAVIKGLTLVSIAIKSNFLINTHSKKIKKIFLKSVKIYEE